jgi:hypothetical protein
MKVNDRNRERGPEDELVYRLEVQGLVGPGWRRWFGADAVRPAVSSTVIEIRVSDQSELFGRLRRIHDLNLRLISVERVE